MAQVVGGNESVSLSAPFILVTAYLADLQKVKQRERRKRGAIADLVFSYYGACFGERATKALSVYLASACVEAHLQYEGHKVTGTLYRLSEKARQNYRAAMDSRKLRRPVGFDKHTQAALVYQIASEDMDDM